MPSAVAWSGARAETAALHIVAALGLAVITVVSVIGTIVALPCPPWPFVRASRAWRNVRVAD